jgi:hypothetical protein
MPKKLQGELGGRRERRAFLAEFKADAVRLMQDRRATDGWWVAQVARELDIRADQLRRWAADGGVHIASGLAALRCHSTHARRWSGHTSSSRPIWVNDVPAACRAPAIRTASALNSELNA